MWSSSDAYLLQRMPGLKTSMVSNIQAGRRLQLPADALPFSADYYVLRRFLRARSYDLEKATTMWMNNLAWKVEFKVDSILQDFYFDERDKFLTCYPQGYHKTDKLVSMQSRIMHAGCHACSSACAARRSAAACVLQQAPVCMKAPV